MPNRQRIVATALSLVSCLEAQDQQMPADVGEVQQTSSGLRYSELRAGDTKSAGKRPKIGDRVHFHYSGWLEDGRLFETSRRRTEPLSMILGVAMPDAWTQGLALMTPGAKFKVYAPSNLGFGVHGAPGKPPTVPAVPANAPLVFEFELVSFEKAFSLHRFRSADLPRQKKTKSGLRYEVLTQGEGPLPIEGQRFRVEFTLWNERGQLVMSSVLPEVRSMTGRIGGAIPGPGFIAEAVRLMPLHSELRVEVPARLCYGRQDRGYLLPPNSMTVWRMKLEELHAAPQPRSVPEYRALDFRTAKRLPSGLRFELVEPGNGPQPGPQSVVEIHYAGWTTDGRVFDETLSEGVPQRLSIAQARLANKGLAEAIQRMRPGAVARIELPPRLAFGLHGHKRFKVGPNRFVLYYLELCRIEAL